MLNGARKPPNNSQLDVDWKVVLNKLSRARETLQVVNHISELACSCLYYTNDIKLSGELSFLSLGLFFANDLIVLLQKGQLKILSCLAIESTISFI